MAKHETGHPFNANAEVQNAISFIRIFSKNTSTTRCFEKGILTINFQAGTGKMYTHRQNINYLGAFKSLFFQKTSAI
jgi:hypothetical protein